MKAPLFPTGLLALVGVALVVSPVAADSTTTINSASNRGSWRGWGVSLAWWGKIFGDRDDLADIFFTLKSPSYNGRAIPGLGLNVVRYNAGATSSASVNGTTMAGTNILPSRQIDGYWINSASSNPASASWNWTVDANQRSMMVKAKVRGADRFELFSNSPMWWMCSNHNPSGARDGSENILPENINTHAVYLATIAKFALDNWGITFGSVEPFNEPSSNWWKSTNNQEGSHFTVPTQEKVISALRAELDNRGLTSMPIAASDENNYDLALKTWNSLDSISQSIIGRVNVHGYEKNKGRRDLLYAAASKAGREIWNTEYGDSDATGMQLAQNLLLDFSSLHPVSWAYWQGIDSPGWGLIEGSLETRKLAGVANKYFVLAQFTRHIREGMRILDSGSPGIVAAYDAEHQKLVIVAANFGSGQNINFDLSKFSKPSTSGAAVARWSTHMNGTEQYVAHNDTFMSGAGFGSHFDTNTIQTFEVNHVSL